MLIAIKGAQHRGGGPKWWCYWGTLVATLGFCSGLKNQKENCFSNWDLRFRGLYLWLLLRQRCRKDLRRGRIPDFLSHATSATNLWHIRSLVKPNVSLVFSHLKHDLRIVKLGDHLPPFSDYWRTNPMKNHPWTILRSSNVRYEWIYTHPEFDIFDLQFLEHSSGMV